MKFTTALLFAGVASAGITENQEKMYEIMNL